MGPPVPYTGHSHAIQARRAAGAVNFTASHNPPENCRMKISTADGAPALPEVTSSIEQEIASLDERDFQTPARSDVTVSSLSLVEDYLSEIEDRIAIGGEESAGLFMRGHIPEKDGTLACLLVAEMVARRGVSLRKMLVRIYGEVSRLVSGRIGVRLSEALKERLREGIATDPEALAGRRVISVNRADGARFNLKDGTLLLMCPSGTEPLVRVYAEASNEQDLEVLLESGRQYILG